MIDRHRNSPGGQLTVEVDPRVPCSTWGRMVYHCDGPGRFIGPAHRHKSPHEIICLAGEVQVACRAEDSGPVTWHRLTQADSLMIAGRTGHRIHLETGSVVAALSPALTWLVPDTDIEQLFGPEWELP